MEDRLSEVLKNYDNFTAFEGRDLAEAISVDYTVFGMAILTLGLLMIVGAVRYFIDAMAEGKFFFENVLEAVYHELSTLGLVEAGIFLLHKYYPELNISVEKVFAEVHFTLFFVAIINAIMSVLLYLFTTRVANKYWVRMETIDLDHYVAIRKQFEAVENALEELENAHLMKRRKFIDDPVGKQVKFTDSVRSTASAYEHHTLTSFVKNLVYYSTRKKRRLVRKHRKLLVQVRFHELRVHFIDSNQLDPRFKVSEYLKLCMLDVFYRFVHISFVTWLILLCFANVVYFCLGLLSAYENQSAVGTALTWVHVGYSILFLLTSLLIGRKMKSIFFLIMKNDHWVRRNDSGDIDPAILHRQLSMSNVRNQRTNRKLQGHQSDQNKLTVRQEDYFWGGDPAYIIFAAQIMQFGYALELAIMLVFNKTLKDNVVDLNWWGYYLLVPLSGYLFFLWIWSLIIPQFTQCTSLGELIHKERLNETRASFKLNQARLMRQEEIDMVATEDEIKRHLKAISRKKQRKKQLSARLIDKFLEPVHSTHKKDSCDDTFDRGNNLEKLSAFVKQDTKDLPDVVRPRLRNKSVSEGVSAMRLFAPVSSSVQQVLQDGMESESYPLSISESIPTARIRTRRLKSSSTGVMMMREAELVRAYPQSLMSTLELPEDHDLHVSSIGLPGLMLTNGEITDSVAMKKSSSLQDLKFIKSSDPLIRGALPAKDRSNARQADDGESDVESFGSFDMSIQPNIQIESDIDISFTERMKGFYMSWKYRRMSAVFGTLLIFFLLGIRLELILLETCEIEDNENTWNFISLRSTFILTTLWLCGFIMESSYMVYTFWTPAISAAVAAGIFDIILSVVCLCLFLVAESDRCCLCDNDILVRYLATEYPSLDDPKSCEILCCPAFGTRLCGGIGSLEPFTSIIIFRMFRFYFGSVLSSKLCIMFTFSKANTLDENAIEPTSEDGTVKEKDESRNDVFSFFESKEGTIAELWAASLIRFPDLVEKHGPFSGMLLEAMLGIEPSPENKLTEPEYKEAIETRQPHLLAHTMKANYSRSVSLGSVKSNADSVEDAERAFQRPASVLIRNMRRCQCKWLPLLDSWEDVDVVLTKYELAWFGINAVDTFGDEEENQKHAESKRILQDSGGGKGMRLCDVIKGRELLGRLLLDDIESVKIVRHLPGSKIVSEESDVECTQDNEELNCEYWNEGNLSNGFGTIEQRWSEVSEDVLTIRTPQGTLCLRFLIDLISAEKNSEKNEFDSSVKELRKEEGALLWLKTIIHSKSKEKVNFEPDQAVLEDGLGDLIETVGDTKKFGRSILYRNRFSIKKI